MSIFKALRITPQSHITSRNKLCLSLNMTEMYNSKFAPIEKRTSDNYDTWKPRISALLSAMLALKIVKGEETEDDLPIGNSLANVAKREATRSDRL